MKWATAETFPTYSKVSSNPRPIILSRAASSREVYGIFPSFSLFSKTISVIINEFKRLLTICLENNIYVLRKRTYKFLDTLRMGGSMIIADVFMNRLKVVLESDQALGNIPFWAR